LKRFGQINAGWGLLFFGYGNEKTPSFLGLGVSGGAGRLFGLGQAKHAFWPLGVLAGEKPGQ